MLLGWQNQYCENHYINKGNLQIQCNIYKITTAFFFFTELEKKKKTSQFLWKHKKPQIAKAILGKKIAAGRINSPD